MGIRLFHCIQCMSPMVNIDMVDLDMDVVDMRTWCVFYREMIKHHTQYCKEFHLRTDLILELLVLFVMTRKASVPSL